MLAHWNYVKNIFGTTYLRRLYLRCKQNSSAALLRSVWSKYIVCVRYTMAIFSIFTDLLGFMSAKDFFF